MRLLPHTALGLHSLVLVSTSEACLHTLTVYGYWRNPTSTFSQPLGGLTFSSSETSCSTSAPFQVGQCPIQPVMTSRCLSAAGFRFLEHPMPTEDFRRSYVRPTDPRQTSVGFPRSAPSSRDWGGCLLYSGVVVSLRRGVCEPLATAADQPVCRLTQHCRLAQSSCPATSNYGASAKIHLRSPVQSFPGLGRVDD